VTVKIRIVTVEQKVRKAATSISTRAHTQHTVDVDAVAASSKATTTTTTTTNQI
jgi:hypothetical protein